MSELRRIVVESEMTHRHQIFMCCQADNLGSQYPFILDMSQSKMSLPAKKGPMPVGLLQPAKSKAPVPGGHLQSAASGRRRHQAVVVASGPSSYNKDQQQHRGRRQQAVRTLAAEPRALRHPRALAAEKKAPAPAKRAPPASRADAGGGAEGSSKGTPAGSTPRLRWRTGSPICNWMTVASESFHLQGVRIARTLTCGGTWRTTATTMATSHAPVGNSLWHERGWQLKAKRVGSSSRTHQASPGGRSSGVQGGENPHEGHRGSERHNPQSPREACHIHGSHARALHAHGGHFDPDKEAWRCCKKSTRATWHTSRR